ncbi:hypothetical protein [Leptolyngbya sp. FACHB-17]|uniref:hypothetical protein n=1 Tax=unclassified Leptolyngbya TaxID=2650499 RepID=UPI0016818329|nr:hypothetical protein [Leptolyngbya sp. FACHB-17]MBD2078916.1 hypothetical protein [Leptolyngbya sp. FACHB-17]
MALTATLALGASLSLAKFAQAEVITIARSVEAPSAGKALHPAFHPDFQPITKLIDSTFDPEPNAPPSSTGGSGTR